MLINKHESRGERFTHTQFDSLTDAMNYYNGVRSGSVKFSISENRDKAKEFTANEYHRRDGGDWTGFKNQDQFMDCMVNGDLEKAKEIWDLATPDITVQSVRRKGVWTDRGEFLDVQRVLKGELDKAWRTTRRRKANGGTRNITILVNLGANCGTSSTDLGWRGVASLKIADTLTEAGYNIRMLGYSVGLDDCSGAKNNSLTTIPIKDFDEGLDVTKLAAIMCRAGFFRTIIFASRCSNADAQGVRVSGGLGRSSGMEDCWQGKYFKEVAYGDEVGEFISLPTVEGREKTLAAMEEILKKYSPDGVDDE